MCSCGGNRPRNPSGGSGTPPASPSTDCRTCTVTLTPKPLVVCVCGSCYQSEAVTASASPSGGTYIWQSSDPSISTVAGSGSTATVRGVAPGTATITVRYNVAGCSCTDTVII